jgi:ribosome-associated protein
MIEVNPTTKIDESEIQYDFIRASGPGGQNVNKVSTACQLRWNMRATTALTEEVKARLEVLAGSRLTEDGFLLIDAHRYRTQEQNRLDALARLVAMVREALIEPKVRRKTRPTRTSSAARVDTKTHRGAVKRTRRFKPEDWE